MLNAGNHIRMVTVMVRRTVVMMMVTMMIMMVMMMAVLAISGIMGMVVMVMDTVLPAMMIV